MNVKSLLLIMLISVMSLTSYAYADEAADAIAAVQVGLDATAKAAVQSAVDAANANHTDPVAAAVAAAVQAAVNKAKADGTDPAAAAAAITKAAVLVAPSHAASITTAAVLAAPDYASNIAAAAVSAAPDAATALAITNAAVTAAPNDVVAIINAVMAAVPDSLNITNEALYTAGVTAFTDTLTERTYDIPATVNIFAQLRSNVESATNLSDKEKAKLLAEINNAQEGNGQISISAST